MPKKVFETRVSKTCKLLNQTVDQFFWACYRQENGGRADSRIIRHDISKYNEGVKREEEIAPDYVAKNCMMDSPQASQKGQKEPFVRHHTHAHSGH